MGMMINRRRVCGGKSLPYDAEIEYLESDAGAYIDTGIKAAGNLIVKAHLVNFFTVDFFGCWPFGGRDSATQAVFGIYIDGGSQKLRFTYNNFFQEEALYSSYPNPCDVEIGNGTFKVGNTSYSYTQRTFTSNYNFLLFTLKNGNRSPAGVPGLKIGAAYVSNGSTTLDLIPVRKGTVGYMYDKVSGQLFGNAGTGNFILGPDK